MDIRTCIDTDVPMSCRSICDDGCDGVSLERTKGEEEGEKKFVRTEELEIVEEKLHSECIAASRDALYTIYCV